jgi:sterol desaturase/sphingolipid hydroxylase (fatty acid hydroxylase superfamily)
LHESGNDFLWKLHEAHHAPKRFSFLSGARGHVLDLSFLLVALAITYAVLGLSHDVRPWVFLYPVMAGAVHHANIDFRLGLFNWLFLGPELHRAHHDADLKDGLSCYASSFPLWDLVFGTARPRRTGGETTYGLAYDYDDRASFAEALVRPFKGNA